MSEKSESRPFIVKLLVVIGFSATVLLIGWAILMLILRSPSIFSSLSERKNDLVIEDPETALTLTTEKDEVYSGDAFTISWTGMPSDGSYDFTYACTPDVSVSVENAQGIAMDLPCETAFSIPKEVEELTVTATLRDEDARELPLSIAFVNADEAEVAKADHTVTVRTAAVATDTVREPAPRSYTDTVTTTPSTQPAAPAPVYTAPVLTYPQSNPYGYADLKIVTLGTGVMERGVFRFTREYDNDETNAVMINIENIGTKTSDYWSFETELPDGTDYTSRLEFPLKPMEHAVFTIPFSMDRRDDETISSRVFTSYDFNESNNRSTYEVDYDN